METSTAVVWILGVLVVLTALAWLIDKGLGKGTVECIVRGIDAIAAWVDRRFNRNRFYGADEQPSSFGPPIGHSLRISFFAFLIISALVLGPTWPPLRGMGAYVLFACGVLLLLLATFWVRGERWQGLRHWMVLLVVAAAVWVLAGPHAMEHDNGLYRHIVIPWFVLLSSLAAVAWAVSWWLFVRYASELPENLPALSLTPYGERLGVDYKRFCRSLVKTPAYHLLEVALWPAFAVLLVPSWDLMLVWVFVLAVCFWVIYAAAEMHDHLDHLLGLLRRAFFLGGQLVVSLLVIVLAVGRLAEVSYIKTLVELSPNYTNLSLVRYIALAYVLFWFYEYWINRFLGVRLLAALSNAGKKDTTPGAVPCKYIPPEGGEAQLGWLRIHGASRFALVADDRRQLETYGRMRLLESMIPADVQFGSSVKWSGLCHWLARQAGRPIPSGEGARLSGRQKRLAIIHRTRFYFTLLNFLLLAAVVWMALCFAKLPQKAELTALAAHDISDTSGVNLAERLREHAGGHAILVAASGGGTRAALYTESLLQGLAGLKAIKDLVLVSGVSGGSAALGYFAAHRDTLLSEDPAEPNGVWAKYQRVMASPFIQDVLEGVVEWRMLAGEPGPKGIREGVRLGQLLSESFAQRFYLGGKVEGEMLTLGEQEDVALIFNTALTGHFDARRCPDDIAPPGRPLSEREVHCGAFTTSANEGGRLVITNLADGGRNAFPQRGIDEAPEEHLPYVSIADPEVPLTTAAALSANFPPVFPNSAVDVGDMDRYWVTDGGASENRGIISLLYALHAAVRELAAAGDCMGPCPVVHVVVAEASATDLGFDQRRGLGAVAGAKRKYASQLMVTLVERIRKDYQQIDGRLDVHYLYMPLVMRSRGGVGTHWMLPPSITVRAPFGLNNDGKESESVVLDDETVLSIFSSLHAPSDRNLSESTAPAARKVWEWICRGPWGKDNPHRHRAQWLRLVKAYVADQPETLVYRCP